MNDREISWQAPSFELSDDKKLAFCRQAIESGIRWVQEQCSSDDLQRGLDILSGKTGGNASSKWAQITTGSLKRYIREIVETLANIRPFWGYQTDNESFRDEANMLNKVTKAVYLESFVDRSLRDALQFGAVTGSGFLHPIYSRSKFGNGEGKFFFKGLWDSVFSPLPPPPGPKTKKGKIFPPSPP